MSERNLSASILRSTSLGHALTDMYWVIFPALLPLIQKEFALSYAQAGLLITSFIVIAGLGSFITGYLGDRFGISHSLTTRHYSSYSGYISYNSYTPAENLLLTFPAFKSLKQSPPGIANSILQLLTTW